MRGRSWYTCATPSRGTSKCSPGPAKSGCATRTWLPGSPGPSGNSCHPPIRACEVIECHRIARRRRSPRTRLPTARMCTRLSVRISRIRSRLSPTTSHCRTRPGGRTSTNSATTSSTRSVVVDVDLVEDVVVVFYEFGDDVLYEIHIDNDGDGYADISYQFRFSTNYQIPDSFLYNDGPIGSLDSPNWNRRQFYDVSVSSGDSQRTLGRGLPCPPCNVGPLSTPDYPALASEAIHRLGGGITVFAGQRAEMFYVDLGSIF